MNETISFGALASCRDFVGKLNHHLASAGECRLSRKQVLFLVLCISGVALQGGLVFAVIARGCFEQMSLASLSYMFHKSKIPWELLLKAAVLNAFTLYKPNKGYVAIDDTDRPRSKVIRAIGFVFKTVCKVSGGYIKAQNLVFVCLMTDRITIPVAFAFYHPDPARQKWKQQCQKAKKARRKGKNVKNPPEPKPSRKFPSRITMCRRLLHEVKVLLDWVESHPEFCRKKCPKIVIKGVLADAAYMAPRMKVYVRDAFGGGVPFISQLKSNQLAGPCKQRLADYCDQLPKVTQTFEVRGQKMRIEYGSVRVRINSHGQRLHVVPVRYDDEKTWRYLASTDLTWRAEDIIRAYGLRWLVETFNEDWKQHGGWGEKALQQGEEGSRKGVFLSLLVDFYFLTHPLQISLHRRGLPLSTAGSLKGRIQVEYFFTTIEAALARPDPHQYVESIKEQAERLFQVNPSKKHAADGAGFELPDPEESDYLRKRFGRKRRAD